MQDAIQEIKEALIEELRGMPRAKYIQTPGIGEGVSQQSMNVILSDWRKEGNTFDTVREDMQSIMEPILREIEEGQYYRVILLRTETTPGRVLTPVEVAQEVRLFMDVLTILSKHVRVFFHFTDGDDNYVSALIRELTRMMKDDLGQFPNVMEFSEEDDLNAPE
jgi:hypothetical protein